MDNRPQGMFNTDDSMDRYSRKVLVRKTKMDAE